MRSKLWCVVCLVLGCAAEADANPSVHDAARLELLAQRVTATVKREAATLVHLETEHEAFITTPEHPFATPRSGWIPAGQLVVGDRVVSARFGTVRVVSLHRETPSRPVPVFNLTVAPSHAYLVGRDHVLVHNVKCKGQATSDSPKEETDTVTRHTRDLEAIETAIEKLQRDLTSAEDKTAIQEQLDDLKKKRKTVMKRLNTAQRRERERRAADAPPEEDLLPPVEDATTRSTRELKAIELEIEKLRGDLLSAQDKTDIQKQLDDLKKKRRTVQKRLNSSKLHERKKRGVDALPEEDLLPPVENATTRNTRELEAIELEIEKLQGDLLSAQDKTDIQKQLDDLKKKRKTVQKRLADSRAHERRKRGEHLTKHEELLERAEADYESVKRALEATQRALRELDAQTPRSDAQKETAVKRKAELQKKLKAQEADLASADQIRTWEREVADFERSRTTKGKDPGLERHISELKVKLAAEKDRKSSRNRQRRKREDPEQVRNTRARTVRDPSETMAEELATLHEQPASPSRDQRIAYLTDAVETLKSLAEIRLEKAKASSLLWKARERRNALIGRGEDTTRIDEKIARVMQEQETRNATRTLLRAHGLLLGLKEVRRWNRRQGIDEARFLALERELAAPTTIDEQRLGEIEREIAEILREESDTLDAEFFEEIWREAEHEDRTIDALLEDLNRESEDVSEAFKALEDELQRSPSPERVTEVQASLDRLQGELAEERQRFQDLDIAFDAEATALAERLEGPGSSRTIQEIRAELEHVRAQRTRLRSDWLERTQARLAEARRQLRDLQSSDRLRDELIEAELAQQVALLEYELAAPPFRT